MYDVTRLQPSPSHDLAWTGKAYVAYLYYVSGRVYLTNPCRSLGKKSTSHGLYHAHSNRCISPLSRHQGLYINTNLKAFPLHIWTKLSRWCITEACQKGVLILVKKHVKVVSSRYVSMLLRVRTPTRPIQNARGRLTLTLMGCKHHGSLCYSTF
eukprot:jgi/Botrbrau1/976/Bobra.114_1s0017.1